MTVRVIREGETPRGSSEMPAAVRMKDGFLYVFHQGWQGNGWLYYTIRDRNGSYGDDTGVPGTGLSFSPSVVLYRGDAFVFHHGRGENGQLWYNRWETWRTSGFEWTGDQMIGDRCLMRSPRAVVYNDKIYIFYHGYGNDGSLRYRVYDGLSFSAEQVVQYNQISGEPAPVVFDGKLMVFYRGRYDDRHMVLHWNIFDGSTWSGDKTDRVWNWMEERLGSPPWPVVVGDRIWLFFFSQFPGRVTSLGNTVGLRNMYIGESWDRMSRRIPHARYIWRNSDTEIAPYTYYEDNTFYAFVSNGSGYLAYYEFVDS